MKHLDRFYNNANIPWVTLTWSKFYSNIQTPPQARCPIGSFWWKEIPKLFKNFKTFSTCNPIRGNSDLFWAGTWTGQPLKERYPQLFSFNRKPKCSIRFFLDHDVEVIFRLPLSTQAAIQLEELLDLVHNINWDESANDSWIYFWGNSNYSSKKAYKLLIGTEQASPLFPWLWPSSNLGKHKFFFRLLLRDRLNTRNLLRRKNMHLDDYNCVLCNAGHEETSFHLFF